ncbi:MAG: FtsQ-type POTRA domain-containing protein [Actinomycetes bacterium]|nr:MAG: hypothetical protein DIU67_04705 [Actinomycetota bacterium]
MDPRLAERRKQVAEEKAKQTVRRLLRFLMALAFLGLVVWFVLSPYMSAGEVELTGVEHSDSAGILARSEVVPGRPLILIRTGEVEAALEEDPWVKDAEVELSWPDRVAVRVTERVPRAWVETAEGWSLRDDEGVALPPGDGPDDSLGRIHLASMSEQNPDLVPTMVGAIEFLASLPEEMARDASVRLQEGELWATVAGWEVRLGRAAEMREKALALVMLLEEEQLEEGSVIVLLAPTRPSVLPPANGGEEEPDTGSEEPEEEGESGEPEGP